MVSGQVVQIEAVQIKIDKISLKQTNTDEYRENKLYPAKFINTTSWIYRLTKPHNVVKASKIQAFRRKISDNFIDKGVLSFYY